MNWTTTTFRHALTISVCLFLNGYTYSANAVAFPTHCKEGEHSALNARMARIVNSKTGYELVKNEKILSICTSENKQSVSAITYRYGKLGAIELEHQASPTNRFKVFSIEQNPVGNNILFFNRDQLTYYISEATNQGHGIHLFVYKGRKQILNLFTGNEEGVDYETDSISFTASPLIAHQKPKDAVW
jgi:hypothetical protein